MLIRNIFAALIEMAKAALEFRHIIGTNRVLTFGDTGWRRQIPKKLFWED
ncbi:hypothetical protein [Paenibacillus oryzisoli]|nr:hypothetical protein [Paenibacillus oryzisoli]